jgi:hypothetical protein
LTTALSPRRITSNGSDRINDIGIDTQYQLTGDRDQISLQASWIQEDAHFVASQPLRLTVGDLIAMQGEAR